MYIYIYISIRRKKGNHHVAYSMSEVISLPTPDGLIQRSIPPRYGPPASRAEVF